MDHTALRDPDVGLAEGGVVLDGSTLLLGNDLPNADALVAVDATGHVSWTATPPGTIQDVVADPGKVVYAASQVAESNGTRVEFLTGYREADGSVASTIELPVFASMSFARDVLYLGDTALLPSTGKVLWDAPGESVFAVGGSTVVTASSTGDLVARNALTGVQVWRATGAGPTAASSSGQRVVVAGSLVFVSHPHVIGIRSLADGSHLGSTPAVGTSTCRRRPGG